MKESGQEMCRDGPRCEEVPEESKRRVSTASQIKPPQTVFISVSRSLDKPSHEIGIIFI